MIEVRKFAGGIVCTICISPLDLFKNKTIEERKKMIDFNLNLIKEDILKQLETEKRENK